MTRILPLLLLSLAPIAVFAQQLSLFTQYRENATLINPAAIEGDYFAFGQNMTFGVSYRAQWVGLANGPRTQTLRGSYLNTDYSGVTLQAGGYLINDQTGPTGFTGVYGRIGGVVSGDPEYSGLSIGLSAGLVQYRVDASKIRLRDQGDVIGEQDQAQLFPDVGFGVYYYQMVGDGDFFYTGVSVPQVIGLELAFQDDNGEFYTKRVQHLYGLLGFYKFFDDDSFLEPSIWVKYAPNAPINADINLRYQMPSSFWIGTGVSTGGNFHMDAGVIIGQNTFDNIIRIGYGFDYSFSSFGPTAGSTHEINLTFSFEK